MAFRSNFTFGSSTAEDDVLLPTAYFDNGDYEAIASIEDPRCFIIGRTGSGKSAALRHLEEKHPRKILRVVPENLSFPYITNLTVVRKLKDMGVHLEPFFKALWKHVIVVEVLKRRYGVTNEEKKLNVLTALKDMFRRDETKTKALEYLNEFGDRFWCETDERVKQIAESFEYKINAVAAVNAKVLEVGAELSGGEEDLYKVSTQTELANRYQRVVNDTQLPRLNEMITILNNSILDSEQHFTYLVIDDLDKQWVEEDLSNLLVRCLLESVVDLQKVRNLKVLVALRTNIFEQLGYEKIAGGQEEKLQSKILHIKWTRNDLIHLLQQRARAASEYYHVNPPKTLEEILPGEDLDGVSPIDYVLQKTLMKPRDAITYLNICIRETAGRDRMTWGGIQRVEVEYSTTRLNALRDEWKDPYLGIEQVFRYFHGVRLVLSRSDIGTVLDHVALLVFDSGFPGPRWLTPLFDAFWNLESNAENWTKRYGDVVELLFGISFLGVVIKEGGEAIYSYSQAKEERTVRALLERAVAFEVHSAFRGALDIKSV